MTIKFFSLISNEIMYRNPKTFDYILFILYFSLLHYVREYKVGTAPLKWGGGRLGGQIARAILRYEMVAHLMLSTSMEGGGWERIRMVRSRCI